MLDCEGSLITVEPIRSLSEMEPSAVSVEVTKSCTNKDHCQSVAEMQGYTVEAEKKIDSSSNGHLSMWAVA